MIGCVYAWGLLGGNMPNNMARVKMLCAKRFPTDTLIIIGTHGFFVNCLFLGLFRVSFMVLCFPCSWCSSLSFEIASSKHE